MEINEIVYKLKYYTEELPKDALKEAINNKELIIPKLLEMLEYTENNLEEICSEEDEFFGYIYAIFLLAEFRETKAFPFLIEILNQDADIVEYIIGDDYPEYLPRLLASTYNGDDDELFSIIENSNLDEFIRSSTLQTFAILYLYGVKDREFIVNYFKKLLDEKSEDDDSYLYQEILVETTHLRLIELDGIIDKVFDEVNYKEEMQDLKETFANENYQIYRNRYPFKDFYEYIYDTVGIMEEWQCFRYKEDEEFEQSDDKKVCDYVQYIRNKICKGERDIEKEHLVGLLIGEKSRKYIRKEHDSELVDKLNYIDYSITKAEWYQKRNENKKAQKLYRIAWLDIQDICKQKNIKSIKEYDEKYEGCNCLLNWIQNYDEILEMSNEENDLCERIRLWRTVEEIFDMETEDNLYWKERVIRNTANAEFKLGNEEKATKIIEDYLVENEKWVWGYVEMSDWYDYERDKKHYNLEKSIEILKRAESVKDLEDKEAILERLEDAYNKLGNKEKAKEYNRKWNEYINQH